MWAIWTLLIVTVTTWYGFSACTSVCADFASGFVLVVADAFADV
jgi:hypothetical protein